jgi:Leucine-rich repeat (LRR) protein
MQVITDAGSVEVGQLFSLVSDRSIRRFEGGNVSRVISDLPQANPTGYATLVSVLTSNVTFSVKHDGVDSATGVCYSVDGGTPVYKTASANNQLNQGIPHNNGAPINISIWPTDYVGADGAVTSVAPRAGNLTYLSFQDMDITSLNASGLAALTTYSVNQNLLTSLDTSGLTAVTGLYCATNLLTSLDVSELTTLTTLSCSNNPLTTIDTTGLTSLGTLYASNTELSTLDLSGLTSLNVMDCSNGQLTSLLATGVELKYTYYDESYITNNLLSEAALIAFVGSLATTTTGQIYYGGNPGSAAFETWLAANPTLDKGYVWIN